jgi:hypothetical protein
MTARDLVCAFLLQSSHAVALQPEKSHGELSQIIPACAERKPPCATQRIRSLLLQRRHVALCSHDQIPLISGAGFLLHRPGRIIL